MFCANLICLKGQRQYYLLLFGFFAFIGSAFSDDLLNWPSKRKTTKALKNESLGFVWCWELTSQWLDEFSVRVSWWYFTRSLTFFTHRMVAYPSDIKQRVVYWEVTRDRDLTSMTWIKKWGWYCGEGRTILKVMYWMLAQLLTFWSIQHIKVKSMIAHIKISILTLFLKDRFKDLGDNLAVIYFY